MEFTGTIQKESNLITGMPRAACSFKCEVYLTRVRGEHHKVCDEFTLEASNAPLGAIDWNRCLRLHHLILHPARPFFYC